MKEIKQSVVKEHYMTAQTIVASSTMKHEIFVEIHI